MKPTLVCSKCHDTFRREEMVKYASINCKTALWYCPKCLQEKQENEWFINEICRIFGVKSPGGRIYKERLELKEKYGYTDKTIIECLEYVYNVEKLKKDSVSLYFVKPDMIEKMMKYKRSLAAEGNSFAQAMKEATYTEYVVPIREATERKNEFLNPDDYFDD